MKKDDLGSQLRQRICKELACLGRLASVAQSRTEMLRASSYERRKLCGKARCRCRQGRLHQELVVAVRVGSSERLVSSRGLKGGRLLELASNWRHFRGARSQMVQTFQRLIEVFDQLGQHRQINPKSLGIGEQIR
jgi:hypothetical protein